MKTTHDVPDGDAGKFLIMDARWHQGGDVVLWWAPAGKGYTTDLDAAGRYTRDDAESQHRSRDTDIPVAIEDAYAVCRRVVTMEKLRGRLHTRTERRP